MSKYVKKKLKIFKDSLKTHQNKGPGALGVLNSESTRKMDIRADEWVHIYFNKKED